jgi:glutamate decarboxylase
MLGGLAALFRWKAKRRAEGKSTDKPNFIISSAYQVVWEKFAHYWELEMREVPISFDKPCMQADDVVKLCDENTFLVVPIQGVTHTGMNDDVEGINNALDELNMKTKWDIPIHVDAATGGFILPFLQPERKWDFRLKWVLSISTSGHKFGLVYPGLGWVIWKDKKYLPDNMVFNVNYLGSEVGTTAINFSRPGNYVLAQYYQFIRLGFKGYKEIQSNVMETKNYLSGQIKHLGFTLLNEETPNPLFCWYMKDDKKRKWTLYDLSDVMRQDGWQIPAYSLPKNMEDVVVMRIVVRQGTGIDLADRLIDDMKRHIQELDNRKEPSDTWLIMNKSQKVKDRGFSHNR